MLNCCNDDPNKNHRRKKMERTVLLDNPETISLEPPQRGDKVTLKCGDTDVVYTIQVVIATGSDTGFMGYIDSISDGNDSKEFLTGGDIVDSLLGDEISFTMSNIYKIEKT